MAVVRESERPSGAAVAQQEREWEWREGEGVGVGEAEREIEWAITAASRHWAEVEVNRSATAACNRLQSCRGNGRLMDRDIELLCRNNDQQMLLQGHHEAEEW